MERRGFLRMLVAAPAAGLLAMCGGSKPPAAASWEPTYGAWPSGNTVTTSGCATWRFGNVKELTYQNGHVYVRGEPA